MSESLSFKKDEEQLLKAAEKYPWYAPAQLYLLHHYKKNNYLKFEMQAPKTSLFFNNTNWLNWQLHLLSEKAESQTKLIDKAEVTSEILQNKIDENISDKFVDQKNAEKNNDINEEVIAFEPLHATDYFASQGIKISEDPIANDKLGNQMKSFTEWLKSMKKIHKENVPVDDFTDKKIQRIAENSNTDADVATEALAEVLIKQNKIEKAIEVYQKLSLNNPSKSAYFAGKINTLKTS